MLRSKQRFVHLLSTAFLIVSLALAGGLSAHALTAQDAEASFSTQDDLEIETKGPECVGEPVNCFEPIIVTP